MEEDGYPTKREWDKYYKEECLRFRARHPYSRIQSVIPCEIMTHDDSLKFIPILMGKLTSTSNAPDGIWYYVDRIEARTVFDYLAYKLDLNYVVKFINTDDTSVKDIVFKSNWSTPLMERHVIYYTPVKMTHITYSKELAPSAIISLLQSHIEEQTKRGLCLGPEDRIITTRTYEDKSISTLESNSLPVPPFDPLYGLNRRSVGEK